MTIKPEYDLILLSIEAKISVVLDHRTRNLMHKQNEAQDLSHYIPGEESLNREELYTEQTLEKKR